MSARRILNVLRTSFLVSALGFGAVAALWPKVDPALSKLDWSLVKLYTRDAHRAFDAAKEQLKAGNREGGMEQLAALAGDLEDIRRGDRLSPLRTAVLDLLADEHQKAGQLEESLRWAEALLDYDPRDFVSMLRRADLLGDLGQPDAAFEQMQAAFKVGSSSGTAQLQYIEMLCERGMREELAETLLALGLRGPLYLPMRGWEFRWCVDTKKDFRPKTDLELERGETGSRFHARIPRSGLLPEPGLTVRGLRIDLPSSALTWVGKFRCDVLTEDGVGGTFTEQDILLSRDLAEDADRLVTTGGVDPFIVFYRADMEAISGVTGFDVSLEAGPQLSPAAKQLLSGPFDPELRARWSARYGEAAVLALESIQ